MAISPGKSFGRYHIIDPPKKGGMASVFKAYDTSLERYVALKVLLPTYEHSEDFLHRFEREARFLAQLTHPNIIPIIDFGEHEGKLYLVMPFLTGGSLKEKVGEPFAWQEAVRILLPMARALAYAHEQGIIHRDIKPSNILFTDSKEPMLADFGVARFLDSTEATSLTLTGQMVGTPEYMAPEQWLGQVSVQVDIYALGVVLYEMITGHKPYRADTPAAVFLKAMNEPLPPPRAFIPGLPGKLEAVLVKALAKKPEERYRDMNSFANALGNLIHQESTTARADIKPLPPVIPDARKVPAIVAVPPAQEGLIPDGASPGKSLGRVRRFLFAGIPAVIILFVAAFACVGTGIVIYNFYPGLFHQQATATRAAAAPGTIIQPYKTPTSKVVKDAPINTPTQVRAPAFTPTRARVASVTPRPPPAATATFKSAPKTAMFTADEIMFCREGPDPSYHDNLTISQGESLPVLARWANGWLLLSINQPDLTRSKCCWVGGVGTLNVDLNSIRLIDQVPDRFTCALP